MNSKLTRRGLMGLTAGAGIAACTNPETMTGKSSAALHTGSFRHGVASGDPLQNSVVLWTRITPETDGDINVSWEVFSDAALIHMMRLPSARRPIPMTR